MGYLIAERIKDNMSYENIDDTGRKVILRKRRRCEWCSLWLENGERAVTRVYKFEGDFNSARMHSECYEAMHEFLPDMLGGEFESGEQGRGCLVGEFEQSVM